MGVSIRRLLNEYGIGAIFFLLLLAYGIYLTANYLGAKGSPGMEYNTPMQSQYTNSQVQPNPSIVDPSSQYAPVNGLQSTIPGGSCANAPMSNPQDLLPRDTNSDWAVQNPYGKGALENINTLNAGYHIGIDTIGQSLRNANQQIRSEPPNPKVFTGPWNQSSIEPDFMRPPLEIGQGTL